jgi:hypothetical protein
MSAPLSRPGDLNAVPRVCRWQIRIYSQRRAKTKAEQLARHTQLPLGGETFLADLIASKRDVVTARLPPHVSALSPGERGPPHVTVSILSWGVGGGGQWDDDR